MSEAALNETTQPKRAGMYDDRIDVDSKISSVAAFGLLVRSLKLLGRVKGLFAGKALLALLAIFPPLTLPWFTKIVVDQVILQQPFGETDVRFPPFMMPFVEFVDGMAPLEIMLTLAVTYLVFLLIFGLRGGGTGAWLTEGQDAATQSELALSAGESQSGGVAGVVEALINIRLTQRIANRLRTELFAKLTRLPMVTLDDHRTGDSVYRVMYDSPQVPQICFSLTLTPILTILGVVLSLYITQYSYGTVAPEVVWIAIGLVPFALIVTLPLSSLARNISQKSRSSGAATTNTMEENIENMSAVQSLGGADKEADKFGDKSRESFKRHRHVIMFGYGLMGFGILLSAIGGIVITVFITENVLEGAMTAGDFTALLAIFLGLTGSASALGTIWIGLQTNVAAVRRVFFFIDFPTEDLAREKPNLAPLVESVTFESVDFAYPDGRQALSGIDLTLEVGQLVAIVGPTGAGKTSLAYLVPGYLQPSAGRILFDGVDSTKVNIDSLRDQTTYVFQEHTLLARSIRDNFRLVKPDATDEDIRRACTLARATEFVDALPEGLDTVLGGAGNTLSVGQQQRLCIARGLIRETPILVLDEPTAALDPQTENALVQSLRDASEHRLVVVIAHRLSTIRRADKIVFLEAGRIRGVGNHDELMADPSSPYRAFVELQNG
jgi:ABC-type multidrug transport system fused ATPase/permease subunit